MIYKEDYIDRLHQIPESYIESALTNIVKNETIIQLTKIRKDLSSLIEALKLGFDYDTWYLSSVDYQITEFKDLFVDLPDRRSSEDMKKTFESKVDFFYNTFYFNLQSTNIFGNVKLSFPFLNLYTDTIKSKENINIPLQAIKNFDNSFMTLSNNIDKQLENTLADWANKSTEITSALEKVNKEVGKIGVRKYAAIFTRQALEHSLLFQTLNDDYDSEKSETGKKYVTGFGKAQRWLVAGIIFGIGLIVTIFKLDSIFPISADTFTPITVFISLDVYCLSALRYFWYHLPSSNIA